MIEQTRADNVSGKSDSSESDGVESPSLKSGGSLSNIGAESDDGKSDSIIPSSSESDDSQVDVDPRAPVATKTTTPARRVVPAAATPAGTTLLTGVAVLVATGARGSTSTWLASDSLLLGMMLSDLPSSDSAPILERLPRT